MSLNKRIPVHLSALALAAVLWQAEAHAQTKDGKGAKTKGRAVGSPRRGRQGVTRRRHGRARSPSRMRRRALLYEPYIALSARKHGVDPRVLWTIAYLETRFRPGLVSPKGARGLMQFMPATARRFKLTDPDDVPQEIDAAARYVLQLTRQFNGRLDLVLASYNAGEGAVECYASGKSLRDAGTGRIINPRGIKTGGIPPYHETIRYVKRGLAVFSRVTSAGIFSPQLIAQTRALQSPPMTIPVVDRWVIDTEPAELGGAPATTLFAGMNEPGIDRAAHPTPRDGRSSVASVFQPVSAAKTGGPIYAANKQDPVTVETVFFDVHSGARYLVKGGQIVKPLASIPGEAPASRGEGRREQANTRRPWAVSRSVYLGGGGE